MLPLQVVPLHGRVAKALPAPQSSMRARAPLPVAAALSSMLLPVHTPLAGEVMDTVDPPPPPFATVTFREAVPVAPAESVTVAVNVTGPFGVLPEFQLKLLLPPLWIVALPALTV